MYGKVQANKEYQNFGKKGTSVIVTLFVTIGLVLQPTAPTYAGSNKLKKVIGIGIAIGAGAIILDKLKKKKRAKNRSKKKHVTSARRGHLKSIQTALNAKGYEAGTPDGLMGRKTRSAIKAFQVNLGEAQTGKLTTSQSSLLLGVVTASASTDVNELFDTNLGQYGVDITAESFAPENQEIFSILVQTARQIKADTGENIDLSKIIEMYIQAIYQSKSLFGMV